MFKKNAFSVQSLLTPNSLSLCALLTIVDNIKLESSLKQSMSGDERLSLSSLSAARMPASSGYSSACVASVTTRFIETSDGESPAMTSGGRSSPTFKCKLDSTRKSIKCNRMKVDSSALPTPDELRLVRTKKRLIQQSAELFNQSPAKSIQFLKDNSIFSSEHDLYVKQLIKYLKETPALDKKVCITIPTSHLQHLIVLHFISDKRLGIDTFL